MTTSFAKKCFVSLEIVPTVTESDNDVRTTLEIEDNPLSNKLFCLLINEINTATFPNVTINLEQLSPGLVLDEKTNKSIDSACKILNKASVGKIFLGKNNKEIGFSYETVIPQIVYENGKIIATLSINLKELLIDLHKQIECLIWKSSYRSGFTIPSLMSLRHKQKYSPSSPTKLR
jgi:hypothetical protein